MILLFNIEYRTNWGEEVRVSGSIPELGNEHPDKALPLQTIDGIHWTAEVNIAMPEDGLVRYSYHIFRDGRHTRAEWNSLPRTLYLSGTSKKTYRIQDCWKNLPEQQYFYTSAFTESLLAHRERNAAPKGHKKGLLIKAYAPCIDSDHCLGICGNQPIFGEWNPDKAVLMSDANFPEWQIEVDATKSASRWNINSFYITRKNAVPFAGKTIRTGIWQTRKQAPTKPLLSATATYISAFPPGRAQVLPCPYSHSAPKIALVWATSAT